MHLCMECMEKETQKRHCYYNPIVTGWLTDDGEVKSVTINGKKEFDSDDKYRLDAEVVVTYHTLKKNKPK